MNTIGFEENQVIQLQFDGIMNIETAACVNGLKNVLRIKQNLKRNIRVRLDMMVRIILRFYGN